jgi:hypothetical protein
MSTDASVEHENLTAALAAAQAEFPSIPRSHTADVRGKDGKAGYSYTYADLADVLAGVRPVLSRHGLALTQRTAYRDGGNGRLALLTDLRHVGGEVITSEVEIAQTTATPQQFGGALTYLRRYEAVTLLGVAAEQDLDAADIEPVRNGQAPPPSPPAWAAPANDEAKAQALEAAVSIVGDRVIAAQWLASLSRAAGGAFPAAVAGWLGSLPQWVEAASRPAEPVEAPPDDPADPTPEEIEEARQQTLDEAKS